MNTEITITQEVEAVLRDCIKYLRKRTVTTQLSSVPDTDGSITDVEPVAAKLISRIRNTLAWKVEDSRMLREQIRVADVAYNHLHGEHKSLLTQKDQLEKTVLELELKESLWGCTFQKYQSWKANEVPASEWPERVVKDYEACSKHAPQPANWVRKDVADRMFRVLNNYVEGQGTFKYACSVDSVIETYNQETK